MRSTATLAVAFLLLLLQSMVLEFAPVHLAAPSFGLLVVLHVGLSPKWSMSSAAIVAFATGYLFDLVSGAPRGAHALVFVLMMLFARVLSLRLSVRGFVLTAVTAFAASMVAGALIVIVRAFVNPEIGYTGLRMTPFEALATGAVAPFVLWMLDRLDGRLDPARSRVGLSSRRRRPLGPTTAPR